VSAHGRVAAPDYSRLQVNTSTERSSSTSRTTEPDGRRPSLVQRTPTNHGRRCDRRSRHSSCRSRAGVTSAPQGRRIVFGRQQHRLKSTPERGTTCAPSVRRTATIIAVAAGLLPQLPAWHPPLTVAPPTLQRSRSGSATARAVTDRIADERRRHVAELMRKAGEAHRGSRKRINLFLSCPPAIFYAVLRIAPRQAGPYNSQARTARCDGNPKRPAPNTVDACSNPRVGH
jgi:hypothetical protein